MGCAKSQFWTPKLLGAWTASTTGAVATDRVILHLSMPTEVHELYGSPSEVWVDLAFLHSSPTVVVSSLQVQQLTQTHTLTCICHLYLPLVSATCICHSLHSDLNH
jgi:hypothetical protein